MSQELEVAGYRWVAMADGNRYEATFDGGVMGVRQDFVLFRRRWRVWHINGVQPKSELLHASPEAAMDEAGRLLGEILGSRPAPLTPAPPETAPVELPPDRLRLLEDAIAPNAKGHRFSVLLNYTADLVAGYGDAQLAGELRARAESIRTLEPKG